MVFVTRISFHFQASAAWDCTVRLWDVLKSLCLHVLDGHLGWVQVSYIQYMLSLYQMSQTRTHFSKFIAPEYLMDLDKSNSFFLTRARRSLCGFCLVFMSTENIARFDLITRF